MQNKLFQIISESSFYKALIQKRPTTIDYLLLVLIPFVAISFVLLAKLFFYKQPQFLALPFDSTLMAVEWKVDSSSEHFKGIARKAGLPNGVAFQSFEKLLIPEFANLPVYPKGVKTKILTFQKIENQIYPVLIVNFKDSAQLEMYNSLPGFTHYNYKNSKFISTSTLPLKHIQNSKKPILSSTIAQDSINNLPKDNILDFYFNHQLISQTEIKAPFSLFENLNDTFAITSASLRENNLGLVLSTYTNPRPNKTIPFTRSKYNPTVPNFLPEDQLFFLGGTGATSRIIGLIQNLPQYETAQDPKKAVSAKILSILNTYNLSIDSLSLLTKIFSFEFAISLSDTSEISLIFNQLNPKEENKLRTELNSLTAYFNPKTLSYQLQDGQVARQLAPDPTIVGSELLPNLYAYKLAEVNRTIYASNPSQNQPQSDQPLPFAWISTQLNPFYDLSLTPKTLSQNNFFKHASQLLYPIADELVYIHKDLIYQNLSQSLDYSDIPSVMTATNFFTDGIQTVSILQW
jgi:hypothetical protein